MSAEKIAVLVDGGFARSKLASRLGRMAAAGDVLALCRALLAHERCAGYRLYRIFYYDAPPFEGRLRHPLSGRWHNHARGEVARANRRLQAELARADDVALRLGSVERHGWRLTDAGLAAAARGEPPAAEDVVPLVQQQGVDLRAGLDIAWLAARGLVHALLLVTGDADFVPAMKLARREGLRVILFAFAHHIKPDLPAHADAVIPADAVPLAPDTAGE